MIIGSWISMKVGQRYEGIIDADLNKHDNPYIILREATLEEWIADYNKPLSELQIAKASRGYFYQISVD